jgi:hypothetical protein
MVHPGAIEAGDQVALTFQGHNAATNSPNVWVLQERYLQFL